MSPKTLSLLCVPVVCLCLLVVEDRSVDAEEKNDDRVDEATVVERRFEFSYAATVEKLAPGASVRMWVPIPPSTEHQTIASVEAIFPAQAREMTEEKYGNRMFYVEFRKPDAKSETADSDTELGTSRFKVTYDVTRKTVFGLVNRKDEQKIELDQKERNLFLDANRMVPLTGKPQELISDFSFTTSNFEVARKLYDVVYGHMNYDKSKAGYGNGDVLWACDSRTGNCTDFHSVFISLGRIRKIPAKFEIGFPIPAKRGSGEIGGYHCWAQFHDDDHGWIPVDISEADKHPERKEFFFGNLDENRVQFSTGRDITLVPQQAGEPLNYFVYPYVEVDGKVWPKDRIKLEFEYADVLNSEKSVEKAK